MGRIAVFGGTFNPIHNGHINLCLECGRHFRFDRIVLIPTNIPPHKRVKELADNQDRLAMCRLAAEGYSQFMVSDLEIRMKGVSYTVHTLERLKQEYPGDEIYLIVGSDMLFTFHRWYRYEELLRQVHLIAGAREPSEYDEMVDYARNVLKNNQRVHIIHIPVLRLSSTQIREMLREQEDVSRFLDEKVYRYIMEHGLYHARNTERRQITERTEML